MRVSRRVVLRFPRELVDQPIICRLVRDYGLDFNILKASVSQRAEGLLILGLSGEREQYEKGIKYLGGAGVSVQPLGRNVRRNDSLCSHCGACVAFCPAGAYEVDPVTRLVSFAEEKCVACGFCIKACPSRAMETRL